MKRFNPRRISYGILAFLAASILTGCGAVRGAGQAGTGQAPLMLTAGHSLGQTFTSQHAGLQGVELYLEPRHAGGGNLLLRLTSSPAASAPQADASLPIATIDHPGWYRFIFPALRDSYIKDYYLLLRIEGEGDVAAGDAPGSSYLDGSAYEDGETALDAQLAFQLVYRPVEMAGGLLRQGLIWLGWLAMGALIFVLPGWALLGMLWSGWGRRNWIERIGLAAGMSLALYPLLMLWTDLVGLHLGAFYAWLPVIGAAAFLVLQALRHGLPVKPVRLSFGFVHSNTFLPDLALVLIAGLVFFVRFYAIRTLSVPLWGDSYQHTMISQLIVDNRGLFESWQPFADLQTLTYHFGFHSLVAVFSWVSQMDVVRSVLVVGQILNGLAVLALYPLATRLAGGNRWAGVAAVLVAGLLSPMPMFYVNWGRYTQLAGQVILPGCVLVCWQLFESRRMEWKSWLVASLLLGGLALTHYRILIFAVLLLPALFVFQVGRGRILSWFIRAMCLGIGGGLLFLPWLINVFSGQIPASLAQFLAAPASAVPEAIQAYNAIGTLSAYLPEFLWLLFPLALAWGLWRRNREVAVFAVWWGLILVAANPGLLNLPGTGALSNFAVFIAFYIPAGVLCGAALGWLVERYASDRHRRAGIALLSLVLAAGLWGARLRLKNDVRIADGALATRADIRAAQWLQSATAADSRFLVNAFFAYNRTLLVGSDGGWWLPLLAQRATMLPPITYSMEQGPRPDYRAWINALEDSLMSEGVGSPHVVEMLRERGISYIYIGQRQGRVNYPGPVPLEPAQLLASPAIFRPIYHQDRVWVFAIVPSGAP